MDEFSYFYMLWVSLVLIDVKNKNIDEIYVSLIICSSVVPLCQIVKIGQELQNILICQAFMHNMSTFYAKLCKIG